MAPRGTYSSPNWDGEKLLNFEMHGKFRDADHLAWALRTLADRITAKTENNERLDLDAVNSTMEFSFQHDHLIDLLDEMPDHVSDSLESWLQMRKPKTPTPTA